MKYKGVNIQQISLFKHPAIYFELLIKLLVDGLLWLKKIFITKFIPILILIASWGLLTTIDSLSTVYAFIVFTFYWVVLGIASSIGLGTGLHTFVLYLGPHIAKVAMVATTCGYLPNMLPSRWEFDHFDNCAETSNQKIGFFGILLAVQIQSFFWGLGTAIGQLPPYFIAYKAAVTRDELKRMNNQQKKQTLRKEKEDDQQEPILQHQSQTHFQIEQQLTEIEQLKKKINPTLMDRAKIAIYDNMEKYGFITILLCASIPNPLFDLAGITCGHFRIPFKKFFFATFIGKAIIKVHIQMIFVITIFRKESLDFLLDLIGKISKSFMQFLKNSFQKQKNVLYHPSEFKQHKPFIGKLWDLFIIFMVAYFMYSILNGLIQEKAIQHKDNEKTIKNSSK